MNKIKKSKQFELFSKTKPIACKLCGCKDIKILKNPNKCRCSNKSCHVTVLGSVENWNEVMYNTFTRQQKRMK